MQFPSKEQVARQRLLYPAGTRIELVQMNDAQAPPVGTRGTVIGVEMCIRDRSTGWWLHPYLVWADMVTGIISADQRPTVETGSNLRNRGDRAYHH